MAKFDEYTLAGYAMLVAKERRSVTEIQSIFPMNDWLLNAVFAENLVVLPPTAYARIATSGNTAGEQPNMPRSESEHFVKLKDVVGLVCPTVFAMRIGRRP